MVQKVVDVVEGVVSMLEEVMCNGRSWEYDGSGGNSGESREYGGRFIVEEELDVVMEVVVEEVVDAVKEVGNMVEEVVGVMEEVVNEGIWLKTW